MDWKKLAPWNWFKHEDSDAGLLFARGADPARSGISALLRARPGVDIAEGPKSYRIRVDLPGVEHDDVSVTVDDGTLVISAQRREDEEQEEQGYHWVESTYGAMQRILALPDDADPDSIRARFRNGVLDLRIGKHPERVRSGRAIEIQSA